MIDFANVSMVLGPAGSPVVRISDGEGTFTIAAGGVAGTLSVGLALDVPGVDLSGTFRVRINTGTTTVDGIAPGFAVSATGVVLAVAGQSLTGGFEIVSDATTGEVVLSLQTMTLRLGNGTETFITMDYYNPYSRTSNEAAGDKVLLGNNRKAGCSDSGTNVGLNDLIDQEAGKLGIPVANPYPAFKQHGQAYMTPSDSLHVHPNDAGYAAIADAFRTPGRPCG